MLEDGVEKIAVMMSIVSNTRPAWTSSTAASSRPPAGAGSGPQETIAIFRIPGAWEDEGFKILERYGVEYCDRSVSRCGRRLAAPS
ncbi:MAG: hypothetical protein U0R26_09060 [Solirubrobacterales bacterium]